jgi:xylulokinase
MFHNWAAQLFRPAGEAGAVESVDPEDVPIFLPYLRGERTPLHEPLRRAEVHDLHVGHGPGAIWRGVHEASGFVVRRHLELAGLLSPASTERSTRIVATGGGSRDHAWVQAIADVTGLPVDCVAVPEGGALGTAYLARVTAGLERHAGKAGRWARVASRVEPDERWLEPTTRRFRRFEELTGPYGPNQEDVRP